MVYRYRFCALRTEGGTIVAQNFEIRPCRGEERARVVQMAAEAAFYRGQSGAPHPTPAEVPERWQSHEKTTAALLRDAMILVAVMDHQIQGYICGYWDARTPEYGYLDDLYVRPESRRQGIGRALLQHMEKALKGCRRLRILIPPRDQTAARFLEKNGYDMSYVAMVKWPRRSDPAY